MKTVFRYFLLLSIVIIPLFVLYKDEEKFPILLGTFLGITITFWGAVGVMKIREKKQRNSG
ncbi:MAG: hypothetical protein FWH59_03605 [Lentimicrobiaceae bacterium]|nr:hypothetical protein [Lentimicrobiaceae bacterium]